MTISDLTTHWLVLNGAQQNNALSSETRLKHTVFINNIKHIAQISKKAKSGGST